jgi:simple sugar transport system ATP-binding protein
MMIGRQVANLEIVEHDSNETLLKVENLTLGSELGKKVLDNVNLYVNAGEIVGIAGVSGNGQTELVRCISGLERNYQGKVTVNGSDVSNFDVAAIRKAGLSHIPEDRYMWGSAREATISDNILMGEEDSIRFSKNGILKQKEIDGYADKLIGEYSIKVDNNKQKIKELSGGNAQKVITAREVERDCPFTIACEPTRGIDIGAMEFVHERLVAKRDKYGGILLVTSELSEIMKLCDRIYVMYNGSINYEFKNEDIDDHKLGVLMLGGKVDENKVVN